MVVVGTRRLTAKGKDKEEEEEENGQSSRAEQSGFRIPVKARDSLLSRTVHTDTLELTQPPTQWVRVFLAWSKAAGT
jgi:hypothetical protein